MKARTAAISVLVAGTLLGALAATPASAATRDCPSGDACIWREANYVTGTSGTDHIRFSQFIYSYVAHYNRNGASANDTADSVYNNGNYESVRFYEHWYHGGTFFELPIKSGDSDLNNTTGAVKKNWHDKISSGYFRSFWP